LELLGHSAHIGEEVEVHYRWHALYGRRVRRYYCEKRRGTDVVVVEGEPGKAIVIPAWMLNRRACAGLEIGEPQVSVLALVDLDRLLKNQGLRRVVSNDAGVIGEARNEETRYSRLQRSSCRSSSSWRWIRAS
jgi:hypothetical protein